uniref:Uncharacterized protein n=1 Tax=Arundo donax TaxID=35708 RepID=A0A0A9EUD4_ARUDO
MRAATDSISDIANRSLFSMN